jgi:NADPH:quinone reductase-like Zn-dependent oxidoreductase
MGALRAEDAAIFHFQSLVSKEHGMTTETVQNAETTRNGATMRAVQIARYGGDDVLEVAEVARPVPRPGQVLVKIAGAGVNYYDVKIREGWLSQFFPLNFPHTLGNDFAGTVEAVGEGVTGYHPGDAVFGLITVFHGGTYAEYLAVDATLVRTVPTNLPLHEAAAMPMVYLTAWIALVDHGQIQPGMNVLVHAGAGGVGGAAIQLAKHFGAKVYATCSTRNCDFVYSLGADEVIDYAESDFRHVVKEIDLAVDVIGGDTNLRTFEVMRPGGTIAVVLRNDPVEMANRERLCAEHGVSVKVVAFDTVPERLDTVRELAEAGAIHANVQQTFPLEQAREAHKIAQTRHTRGRIVLLP